MQNQHARSVNALVVLVGLLFTGLARAEEAVPLPPPNYARVLPSEVKRLARRQPQRSLASQPEVKGHPIAHAEEDQPWYRDVGEYISSRSVRWGVVTDTSAKVITDGKRFDVTLGKRIPLYSWGQVSRSEGWTVGIDGGMLASLQRSTRNGHFIFATNTFDGFFGAFVGYAGGGWLAMFRTAHLSAHLVDNAPTFATPTSYSQFWNELIVGKTFPLPEEASDWEVHLQGSVGLNNTSSPSNSQPRASVGADFGYTLGGPNSLALVASADLLRAGVQGQKNTYSAFLGLGSLNRPQLTHRPFRAGVAHFWGSDFRNQYYGNRQSFTAFVVNSEF